MRVHVTIRWTIHGHRVPGTTYWWEAYFESGGSATVVFSRTRGRWDVFYKTGYLPRSFKSDRAARIALARYHRKRFQNAVKLVVRI